MVKVNDLGIFLVSLSGVAYLWFGGIHFMGIHLPPLMAALGTYVALTLVFLKARLSISPTVKAIFWVSLALIGWMFVREFFAGAQLDIAMKVIGGRILVGVVVAFATWVLTTEVKHLRFLTFALIVALAISAIVGIGQYFVKGFFIKAWELTGGYLPKLREVQLGYVAGLASYSIPFGYQLCTCVPLVFGLLLSRSTRYRKSLTAVFLLLLLALFLTQSRSAIIGALMGVVVIIWSSLTRGKLKAFLLVLSLGAMAYLFHGMHINPRLLNFVEYSAQARFPLFLVALWTGVTHPLGTGRGTYIEIASGFYEMVEELPSATAVFKFTAHNQFLNMLGYYGMPGLALLIIFYVLLFRLFRINRKSVLPHPFLNGMRIGLLGAFSAYLVDSFFHNAGPFIGDPINWYFIGLALAAKKLTVRTWVKEPQFPLGVGKAK